MINPFVVVFWLMCAAIGWLVGHTLDAALIGFVAAVALSFALTAFGD